MGQKDWSDSRDSGNIFAVLIYVISAEFSKLMTPIRSDIVEQIGTVRNSVSTLSGRIEGIDKRQDRIDAKEIPSLITAPPPKTTGKLEEYLKEKGEIATSAKLRQIPIDPKFVSDAARQALAIDASQPEFSNIAWKTTTELLDYNSFLASLNPVPAVNQARPIKEFNFSTTYYFPHEDAGVTRWFGVASRENAAHLDLIGIDQNTDQSTGPQFLVISGGDVILDGIEARNIVFINKTVVYKGGKVILDSVYFINCVFRIEIGRAHV